MLTFMDLYMAYIHRPKTALLWVLFFEFSIKNQFPAQAYQTPRPYPAPSIPAPPPPLPPLPHPLPPLPPLYPASAPLIPVSMSPPLFTPSIKLCIFFILTLSSHTDMLNHGDEPSLSIISAISPASLCQLLKMLMTRTHYGRLKAILKIS